MSDRAFLKPLPYISILVWPSKGHTEQVKPLVRLAEKVKVHKISGPANTAHQLLSEVEL